MPSAQRPGIQRRAGDRAERGSRSSAATPCWAATPPSGVWPPERSGRKRPDLRCLGPCRASQVARRAASSRASSSSFDSSSMMLSKPQASVIAVPMIPLVNERLEDLVKQGQAPMKSTSHVRFGDVVATCGDAESDALNRVALRGPRLGSYRRSGTVMSAQRVSVSRRRPRQVGRL